MNQLAECWVQPQQNQSDCALETDTELESVILAALAEPVGSYPPINDAVFGGDTVAIVLQDELPRARVLLDCLLNQLLKTDVETSDISIVVTPAMAKALDLTPIQEQPPSDDKAAGVQYEFQLENEFQSIRAIIHDAEDNQNISYIAANHEGLPVKVNRAIVEADVILPVGCPVEDELGELSDCIYPSFCNTETQHRFGTRKNSVRDRRSEIALANAHLGTFSTLQIVVGPGGRIVKVISGERSTAIELARSASVAEWRIAPIEEAEMVIATIENDARQQSWRDFAKAVVAANSMAAGAGPIFVWSQLNEKPGKEIRKALGDTFESKSRAKLSGLMLQLAGVVSERQVYLKSRLSQSIIEELGLGFVDDINDLSRMINSQSTGIVLRDAHRCQLSNNLENQNA